MNPDLTTTTFEVPGVGKVMPLNKGAEVLGIATVTLRRWAREGKVRTFKLGRARRISAAEINRILGSGFRFGGM
jgi:excisionase family DNA binding protein